MEKRFGVHWRGYHGRCVAAFNSASYAKTSSFSARWHGHQCRNNRAYFAGQAAGATGGEYDLADHSAPGLIKTYNTDAEVPDSAGNITR